MSHMLSPVPVDRPNPLREAAAKTGTAWSAVSGVIGALVTFGALTAAQGHALDAVGGAAPDVITALGTVLAGVLPLLAGLVGAFRTASAARPHVTPTADPRTDQGVALVPAE